jgi:hypothetical protein
LAWQVLPQRVVFDITNCALDVDVGAEKHLPLAAGEGFERAALCALELCQRVERLFDQLPCRGAL